MSKEEHELALSKAKIQLMTKPDSVFFTTMCFSLRHAFDDSIPTACTDGRRVLINPAFFMGLSADQRVFLLLHETMHCAYLHMFRKEGRDQQRWNIACDHVINLQLLDRGFVMPQGGLADPTYKDMGAEQVYGLLPPQPPSTPMGGFGPDLQDPGQGGDADGDGSGISEEIQRELQDALIRAVTQSKLAGNKPGSVPGDVEIFINGLLDPKLPWQRLLQKYMQKFNKVDYSFRKPNRRFFPQHYLPSLYGEALIDLAVAIDTSGSVSDEDFKRFISEISGILKMMKPERISLIQFDTEIKSVDEVKSFQELMKVRFTGRGGTNIEPVYEWAEANKPQALLVFTDGFFSHTRQAMKQDVLWLIHNNPRFAAPFGKVIHYEV